MSLPSHLILRRGWSPILAAAIHAGHGIRPELEDCLGSDAADRLREEAPFSAEWTQIATPQVLALRSRFEVDFNRPRAKAVYVVPTDAWNLELWKVPLTVCERLAKNLRVRRNLPGNGRLYERGD